MINRAFDSAMDLASGELSVEIAAAHGQVCEAQRIRYKALCQERGVEPGTDGLQDDEFDVASRHVLVRSQASGDALGTARIVLPSRATGHGGFPMQRACGRDVLRTLPVAATGEISCFALMRGRHGVSHAAAAMIRLFLMRGVVQVSGETGLTHWCALMEGSLLRLLRATAIHFEPVGPALVSQGMLQPAIGAIAAVLDRTRREQPCIWSFLTGNGVLWPGFAREVPKVRRLA